MMPTVEAVAALRETVAGWRRDGARVGFVPTMGNLHQGHYSLVDAAHAAGADRVVASVFVNPTQFGPREDFASYPRTLAEDKAGLEAHGCDLLFAPTVDEIYPYGPVDMVRIEVPIVSAMLEGEFRPGHFAGVATVVTKLFNMVQPDVAVFGQKDYQQLLVIRRMVHDLALPIDIVSAPTLREANGLAMSSRNQYLTPQQREHAGLIHRTLRAMAAALHGDASIDVIERQARATLERGGFQVDYIVVRRADDLGPPEPAHRDGLVALAAAKLGRARLIDNFLTDL